MGLAFGTIPFLLKEHGASYADLATFSFASTPYSVKLFIAPIVDSLYNRRFGRRKSWIVPVQLVIGLTTFTLSNLIQNWVLQGVVSKLMPTFLIIIAMTATQDIAVDGWSLTMLSHKNVAYASTCQSLGLSAGYFATFTIFLAFSNPEFSNNYVRRYLPIAGSGPVVTLASALRLMGFYYLFLTAYVTFFKKEVSDVRAKKNDEVSPPSRERDMEHVENEGVSESESVAGKKQTMWQSICATYADLLVVIRLPAVQALVLSLLIAKVGFSAYDNGTCTHERSFSLSFFFSKRNARNNLLTLCLFPQSRH